MISIKTEREIELLDIAGKIVYDTHQYLKQYVKPGITTNELDQLAEKFILSNNSSPAFKNYDGFPKSICTSVNDQVVHGIPGDYILKDGDIISIDIGVCYKGYYGDSAWTYSVGNISEEKQWLLKHTEQSLYEGIKMVKPGNKIGDIGYAIEQYALKHSLGVVKEFVGHGVGNKLHEEPDVPNYGEQNKGVTLKKGMVIAIEPMLNLGDESIYIDKNKWTVYTCDGSPSAHYEHTVLVTEDGYRELTKR